MSVLPEIRIGQTVSSLKRPLDDLKRFLQHSLCFPCLRGEISGLLTADANTLAQAPGTDLIRRALAIARAAIEGVGAQINASWVAKR
jgi:hypothetical protein